LRGANGPRACAPDDRLYDETISALPCGSGLLRFAAGKIADHLDRLAMEAAIPVLDKVV
jgi:hypothetical protein